MSQTQTKSRGFTIVELLIVIVVIAILAAITIVAYNGIQNRARTSASQSAANTVIKKAEAANALAGSYPSVSGTGTAAGTFGANNDSSLAGSGITLAAITAAPADSNTVEYQVCTTPTGSVGARVAYWDSTLATPSKVTKNIGAACTAWGTAFTGAF